MLDPQFDGLHWLFETFAAWHGTSGWGGLRFRFTPVEVELREDGEVRRFMRANLLRGWALDKDGRVCAVHRAHPGFEPSKIHQASQVYLGKRERAGGGSFDNFGRALNLPATRFNLGARLSAHSPAAVCPIAVSH